MSKINRDISIGVLWNLASIFMSRGASIVFTLFLARLLTPNDFGLVAMIVICFELAGVFVQSGLGQALIQSEKVSDEDLSTVFITNMAMSAFAYCALFLSAPWVAKFYQQPELTLLVRVMGLVVFINAMKIVPTATLSRAMNFKSQMVANTSGVVSSGIVAVTLAYNGAGVWSLVAQMVMAAFVSTLLLWFASVWRPSLIFSVESFLRLFQFGVNLLIEGFLAVLYQNSYVLVIGRFYSAEATGLYFLAKKISNLVSQQMTSAVQQVTFPALSKLQNDNEKLRYKYRQIIQMTMFMIAPVMLLLASLSRPVFEIAFSEKWQGSVPYLQLLCVVGMIYPLHALNVNIMNVKGRSDLVLKVGLAKKAVNLSLLGLSLKYGVLAIAISQVLGSVLALVPNTYYSARLVNYGLVDQLKDAAKPVLSALIAASGLFFLLPMLTIRAEISLPFCLLLGALIYLSTSYLVKSEGMFMCINVLKYKIRKQ
ncbi:lipopolysaccharide biosynthesis protein [Alloalcanivorax mobilis]|uniref:lipopolysaccharide biosynthesis protein n=1 Tax=Alloalcanivorax mobilis TaxID=2019569 RepID=UPI000C760D62|nr:lipopolysaccharide biosynthesis protein [Alloalcanivorax mobilis]